MRQVFVCVLLVAAAAMCAFTGHDALAQGKKDKEVKKDKGVGTIEISEGKDGKFRFNIRNADGKYLGGSGPTGFASEKDARAAIDELKEVLGKAKVVMAKKEDKK